MLVVSRLLSALGGVPTKPARHLSTSLAKLDRGPVAKEWPIFVEMLRDDVVYLSIVFVALTSIGGYTLYSVSHSMVCYFTSVIVAACTTLVQT